MLSSNGSRGEVPGNFHQPSLQPARRRARAARRIADPYSSVARPLGARGGRDARRRPMYAGAIAKMKPVVSVAVC